MDDSLGVPLGMDSPGGQPLGDRPTGPAPPGSRRRGAFTDVSILLPGPWTLPRNLYVSQEKVQGDPALGRRGEWGGGLQRLGGGVTVSNTGQGLHWARGAGRGAQRADAGEKAASPGSGRQAPRGAGGGAGRLPGARPRCWMGTVLHGAGSGSR